MKKHSDKRSSKEKFQGFRLAYIQAAFLIFFSCSSLIAQNPEPRFVLSPSDFLNLVKQYHPVAKQATLIPKSAQAKLLQARGGFDPKLFGDVENKTFKETEYYSLVNGGLKVPTWYGIEFKADYSYARGSFINPKESLPDQGLVAAGLSIPLGRGLWIDQRRAVLRQAQVFRQASETERIIALNDLLWDASKRYVQWAVAFRQREVLQQAVAISAQRLAWVRQSYQVGDEPAIDTVEATIQLQNVTILLQEATLSLQRARLEVATFLWTEEGAPLELREATVPGSIDPVALGEDPQREVLDSLLNQLSSIHPEMLNYRFKLAALEIDRRMAAENLKPRINFNYHFLNESIVSGNGVGPFYAPFDNNYKWGLDLSFSLFLRKERGKLQEVKLKQQDTRLARDYKVQELSNKILAYYFELTNQRSQFATMQLAVQNYQRMLDVEALKFRIGESSLFLINSRQNKLIDAQLKLISLEGKLFKARASLAWASGLLGI